MYNLRPLERDRRHPWRVAVLDTDLLTRVRLVDMVRAAGATVCVSAAPHLDVARIVLHTAADVALMGLEGPEPEPLELAATIECPVVLCSGDASSSMISAAQRAKAMAFLVRPIRRDQLKPTLALAIARFRDQRLLQRALEERKLIERAKGHLMTRDGVSKDEAFRWLRQRAMDTRARMADVARQILAPGSAPAPPSQRDKAPALPSASLTVRRLKIGETYPGHADRS